MAVAIELQAERRPGRHAKINQPPLGIHEVEIIMQALAAVRPHIGAVGGLVVPGLVGIAGFHRRNDMHKAGTVAASGEDFRDNLFFADVAFGDVLDRDSGLHRHRRGARAHRIAQRRGKLRIIENPNLVGVEKPRHSLGVAHPRKRPRHHHPIKTGQHRGNPLVVAFRQ
jgi:hypothetical protein